MLKLIFKAYKIFFYTFFSIYKNAKKKRHVKIIKIFLKKKEAKGEKRPLKDIEILLKRKKNKSVSIIVNDIEIFKYRRSKTKAS